MEQYNKKSGQNFEEAPPKYSANEDQLEYHRNGAIANSVGQPPTSNAQILQQQPVLVVYSAPAFFGPDPILVNCSYCDQTVLTKTNSSPGVLTWMMSWLCCCVNPLLVLVPCCIRECKDIVHSCPNCQRQLGIYERIR